MTRCTWPVRGPRDRRECGHQAVAVVRAEVEYPRCRRHMTKEARALADEKGYEVVEV